MSLQAAVAAWMAVHALAKRGVGKVFGTVETAYPDIIKHETWHGVDDVEVVLSDGGRLFLQATRQPKPAKVADFLKQATETWLAHKTSAGGSVQRPLTRSKDALVLVVPGDARKNLAELEAVFRKFDGFDRWSEVPLALTGPQDEELSKAKAAVVATWKRIKGAVPTDDELVELFGLLRVVRFDLDPGEGDERLVLALLQDGVGLTQAVASRAWDRLCRENIDWMQRASGANRAGICRYLKTIDIDVDGGDGSLVRQDVAVVQSTGSTELAQRLIAAAEIRFPPHLADEELRRLIKRTRQRVNFRDPAADYGKEIGELAQRAIDGDLSGASADARWMAIAYAARAAASRKDGAAEALALMAAADKVVPGRSHAIVEAGIHAHADTDAALKLLRDVTTPDGRSQLISVLRNGAGPQAVVDRVRGENWTPGDINAVGAHNVGMMAIEVNEFDFATSWVKEVSDAQLEESPSLLVLRADLALAETLPPDERMSVIMGLPFDLGQVHPHEDAESIDKRRSAAADIAKLIGVTRDLGLTKVERLLEERLCWLEALDPEKVDAAKAKIGEGLKSERHGGYALRFGSASRSTRRACGEGWRSSVAREAGAPTRAAPTC